VFFAQDWMVRFRGRQQMAGKIANTVTPIYLKLFFEITIVYFLLLASLRLVEIYTPLTFANIISTPNPPHNYESSWTMPIKSIGSFIDKKVVCLMAVFAIMSGLWNSVMIAVSAQVNKNHVLNIVKGHLENEIIKLFPVINGWINDYKAKTTIDSSQGLADVLGAVLRSFRNPHHLILPYLFTFHIVALNYILGVFILFSAFFMRGESIWEMQPILLLVLIIVLMAMASFFLAIHFSSDKRPTIYERIACLCIAATILLIYAISPANILVLFVVMQQIAANYIMSKFFYPSSITKNDEAKEPIAEEAGGVA
jgi:hypothetical protein